MSPGKSPQHPRCCRTGHAANVTMTTKLFATILRWTARILGTVLVGLTLLIAIGEGMPNPFTQPFVIGIGFLALALVLLGILLAWRWEFLGGIMSLVGWVLFFLAERVSLRQSVFIALLGIPSLLFLGSWFLRCHYAKHNSADEGAQSPTPSIKPPTGLEAHQP